MNRIALNRRAAGRDHSSGNLKQARGGAALARGTTHRRFISTSGATMSSRNRANYFAATVSMLFTDTTPLIILAADRNFERPFGVRDHGA
jgi:hypothetical protein